MSKPQTLRLAEGQSEALTELAERFQTSQAQIARWAIDALIESVEAAGGEITLPFKIRPHVGPNPNAQQ